MTSFNVLFLSILLAFDFATAKDSVVYIQPSAYKTLKTQIPKPPAENSIEQKADEQELRLRQKNRTAADCAQARLEATADFAAMFSEPKGPLTTAEIAATQKFFSQIRSNISPFIGKMKSDFPRKRPFLYLKDIEPCVPKDDSGAYPSGHGTIGHLYALILSDIFPKLTVKLEARGLDVGQNRVMAGVHHPSDIVAGRKLGELLYHEIKKSKTFQDDLSILKRHLSKM